MLDQVANKTPDTEGLIKLLENHPIAMVIINQDSLLQFANLAARQLLGLVDFQPSSLHLADLCHTDQGDPLAILFRQGNSCRLQPPGSAYPIDITLHYSELAQQQQFLFSLQITPDSLLNANFLHVIQAAPCGIIVVDTDGTIQLVNQQLCSIFGYQEHELITHPMEILLPERYRHSHVGLRAHFVKSPERRSMGPGRDLTGQHKDGSEFPVEIGLAPILLTNGKHGVIATITDITVRKKLQNQFKQLNASLDEFNYIVSHDLKSPLRGIHSLVEWIKEDLETLDNPEVLNNLERISLRVCKLENLVEDMLTFSRATRQNYEISRINLAELIQQEIELLAPPEPFTITLQCAVAQISTTRIALATVIRNLLSNAIKHHHQPRGHILIKVQDAGSVCDIRVIDDGPGIPDNAQQRIFQLFQTLNKEKQQTSGIGLAICKRLVESHGGSIQVNPGPDNQGTEFRFSWPKYTRRDTNG